MNTGKIQTSIIRQVLVGSRMGYKSDSRLGITGNEIRIIHWVPIYLSPFFVRHTLRVYRANFSHVSDSPMDST